MFLKDTKLIEIIAIVLFSWLFQFWISNIRNWISVLLVLDLIALFHRLNGQQVRLSQLRTYERFGSKRWIYFLNKPPVIRKKLDPPSEERGSAWIIKWNSQFVRCQGSHRWRTQRSWLTINSYMVKGLWRFSSVA